MKFQTMYRPHEVRGEINLQPSETVPDLSLSIKQIVDRYSNGWENITGLQYDDEENPDEVDLPDLSKMDISEIHDFKLYVKGVINANREKLAEEHKTRLKSQQMEMYKKWKEDEANAAKQKENDETGGG